MSADMPIIDSISEALQKGKSKDVVAFIGEALNSGVSAQDILDKGLLHGMSLLGVKFKNNEVFVPEVLVAARALNKGTEVLKPRLIEAGVKPIGKVIICTVKGDLQYIGKNLVRMMLEGAGFEVIDLGVDVDENKIIEAVKEQQPQVLCLSALLTTTMTQQGVVIEALKAGGLREKVKVMVGGAPVTQSFCESIHADAYTQDAASAAETAKAFVV
jgi:5-methyltetrahydrofolate--homocysteine methyltransferase